MGRLSFDAVIRDLRALRDTGSRVFAVHYACENLFTARDKPPAIAAIAFQDIFSLDAAVYCQTDRAENGERHVLESYKRFLAEHPDARLIHWNMNSAEFGFRALSNRFAHVIPDADPPIEHPADREIDLDDLMALGYGRDFADHPKLVNIAKLNDFQTQYFLSGKEEADRFEKGDLAAVRRSVAEKAKLLTFLTKRLVDGTLETKHSGLRLQFASGPLDSVQVVVTIANRMREVERQLRIRHDSRTTLEVHDEHDAQDLFHAVLRLFFDDIREESGAPGYAGGSSRMDFLLPRYRLAVELKHARASMSGKDLGDQLIIDIDRYKRHPDVRHLVCLVFDREGHIHNPRGLEHDLSTPREGLAVTVRIIDR